MYNPLDKAISSCRRCKWQLRLSYEKLLSASSKLVADWRSHNCFDTSHVVWWLHSDMYSEANVKKLFVRCSYGNTVLCTLTKGSTLSTGTTTRSKFESWKVRVHTQNASQSHLHCFLKDIWILKSGCSLKSPTHNSSVNLGISAPEVNSAPAHKKIQPQKNPYYSEKETLEKKKKK